VYRTAFPDLMNTIHNQIAESDMVMTRGTARGTHLAPLEPVPASGKSVAVDWVILSRFDGDRIADEYEILDALGMMQRINPVPTPA
jgi:predicted ester cyclase